MLNKDRIDRNINWLLENASPPVLYLTHKYLLNTAEDGLRDLWLLVLDCPEVSEIFGKQGQDGSWCAGGSWAKDPTGIPKAGYSAFTPKYNTTVWVLSVLGDVGFTVDDERVRKAVDYTLTYQWDNGLFSRFKYPQKSQQRLLGDKPDNAPCELGVFLVGLGKVNNTDISQLDKSYDLLKDFQREDGGWVLERHRLEKNWTRSCPWASYHATTAMYHSKDPANRDALIRGLEFLVWHLNLKNDFEIQRFFYHGHSTVHELLMLSEYEIGLDERPVRSILEWLMTMYDETKGHFHYEGKPIGSYRFRQDYMNAPVAKYRLHYLIEDDWLTYYSTRIGKNLIQKD